MLSCEEGGGESSSGGGLFANHKEVDNALSISTPTAGVYEAGDNLDFVVSFPFSMSMTAGPVSIDLDINGNTRTATYLSGNNSKNITLR